MPKQPKKPITELSDEEAIKKLFPAKVVKTAKQIAQEAAEKQAKAKQTKKKKAD